MKLNLSPASRTQRILRMCFCITTLFAVILFSSGNAVCSGADDVEYKLKAAFMLNFARFINWPEEVGDNESFKICIYGQNPFGSALSGIEKKTIAGNPVDIVMTGKLSDLKGCRLVFISRSEEANLLKVFKEIEGEPIVAVSDIKAFAEAGGTMEFVSQNNKLGFKVNHTKAKMNGLKINASLLGLAVEVL
jgi:hypothetical protein